MNADDRQLISDLFQRIRNSGELDKDRDAEAFIHDSMRQNPDSPYLLVQSVLVQEQALQKADARIRELEDQVDGLEDRGAGQPVAWEASSRNAAGSIANSGSLVGPRSSAGFSGGNAAASPSSAVPAAGRSSPWQVDGNGRSGQSERPSSGGGGFMAQAMTTAAGVAGGMLLANGISSLFSGGSGAASSVSPLPGPTDATAGLANDGADQLASDGTQPTPDQTGAGAMQDASLDDDTSDWGGGDDWGDGFDI